jgi:hypothetical protein
MDRYPRTMRLNRSLWVLPLCALLLVPEPARAQKDVREISRDHSTVLNAGDLNITFIYLNRDSTEVAKLVLTSEEYRHYDRERLSVPKKGALLAVRVRAYRDTRFDPTQIVLTQREATQMVGFQEVVDVQGMFNSSIRGGDTLFGFIKTREQIDFRRAVTIRYERASINFLLPLKWRQKYFQFLDAPGR